MKLLSAVLPRVQRLIPSSERGMALVVVGFLIGLEIVGRMASTEWQDALAGAALVLGILCVLAWHRTQPIAWVQWVGTFLAVRANRFDQLKYDVGIDFRGTPPMPQRIPRLAFLAFAVLVVWGALAALAWWAFPNGWRELGMRTSYVLYLIVLMSLWSALAACIAAGIYLPVSIFDQKMRLAAGERDPHGADGVVLLGYLILATLVTWITPPIYGLSLCVLVACLALVAGRVNRGDDAVVLWRSGVGKPIFGVPIWRIITLGVTFVSLAICDLILTACGGRLLNAPALDAAMPVTGFLGALSAWLIPGILVLGVYQVILFRRTDPTRRLPLTVNVDGSALPAELKRAKSRLKLWGFLTRKTPADTESVSIRLVPTEQSQARDFDPRWPLKVSLQDLDGPASSATGTLDMTLRERLARRGDIRLRRRFIRGVTKLIKQATIAVKEHQRNDKRASGGPDGGGFWIAPHWWFIETLLWEDPTTGKNSDGAEALRPIGPPYHRLFGARVRQHMHQVLRTLHIDLIYLEQGVGHKRLEQVLRSVLELYDVHGGRKRAEEHHFHGVPKVRVMIHDYSPGNQFQSDMYPEPKFDDVSRFRVLHIFRDRGESEETVDAPFDYSWEPMPLSLS